MSKKFDLTEDVPYIHNRKELSLWLRPMYIIEEYLVDDETYTKLLKQIMNLLKGCFPIRQCRNYPIRFKFNAKSNKEHVLPLRHFAVNLILWNPFIELSGLDVLNEEFIIDCEKDIPDIEEYINYKLITILREYHVKSTKINYRISDVLYNLRSISIDFSLILGLNFNADTFFEMYEKNDEIREMMEIKFDDNLQPHEIEQQLAELQEREISIYRNDPGNPIGVLLNAKTGVKNKQLTEFTIAEGLKPSLEGVTVPEPIENSTLLRGLDRPSYLYISAIGSRKSLVMNKKVINILVTIYSDVYFKTSLIAGNF